MLAFLGSTAIALAALTSAPTSAVPGAAQSAPVTAPVAAADPRRRRHANQSAVVVAPGVDSDREAIEEQLQMRVLMPEGSVGGGS